LFEKRLGAQFPKSSKFDKRDAKKGRLQKSAGGSSGWDIGKLPLL
jgi:hypothetical protein